MKKAMTTAMQTKVSAERPMRWRTFPAHRPSARDHGAGGGELSSLRQREHGLHVEGEATFEQLLDELGGQRLGVHERCISERNTGIKQRRDDPMRLVRHGER